MTKHKHTPGPWVWQLRPYGEPTDARLITAAPDLLAALLSFNVNEDDRDPCFCDQHQHTAQCKQARAAVEKARGGA